ncbi:MAG: hypothetical protein AAFY71_14290 [Bacteroidota bacterium]
MKRLVALTLLVSFMSISVLVGQNQIQDFSLRIDTSLYSWKMDGIRYKGRRVLPIRYEKPSVQAEFQLSLRSKNLSTQVKLIPSSDYKLQDSIRYFQDNYFLGKVLLNRLDKSLTENILLRVKAARGDSFNLNYPILPFVEGEITVPPKRHQVIIGEVYSLPLSSSYNELVKTTTTWEKNDQYAYRVLNVNKALSLEIIAFVAKDIRVNIPISTRLPRKINGELRYQHTIESFYIEGRPGSLKFLDLKLNEIQMDRNSRGLEIPITFERPLNLDPKKIYRLEEKEALGSKLIAEIFTEKILPNRQMKGKLKIYDYHKQGAGNIYMKRDEKSLFLVNLSIVPTPSVNEFELKRKGKDWTKDLRVYPGDTVSLRWKGESLDRANWEIQGLQEQIQEETLVVEPEKIEAKLIIPVKAKARKATLLIDGKETAYSLNLSEFSRAKKFNFVSLGFEGKKRRIYGNKVSSRPKYVKHLEGMSLQFYADSVEKKANALYGIQHVDLKVTLVDPQGRILEMKELSSLAFKPGKTSPRAGLYQQKAWGDTLLQLDKLLVTDLKKMRPWTKITIEMAHDQDYYEGKGLATQWTIILRRDILYDVEVGFPVGIITNNPDYTDGVRIDGASLFIMAQMGFYQRNKTNTLNKFRIGVGPVALNALNFRKSNRVDLGVASMLHLYPTNQNSRLSVPLSFGGGYAITREYWFLYAGAGLTVRL